MSLCFLAFSVVWHQMFRFFEVACVRNWQHVYDCVGCLSDLMDITWKLTLRDISLRLNQMHSYSFLIQIDSLSNLTLRTNSKSIQTQSFEFENDLNSYMIWTDWLSKPILQINESLEQMKKLTLPNVSTALCPKVWCWCQELLYLKYNDQIHYGLSTDLSVRFFIIICF